VNSYGEIKDGKCVNKIDGSGLTCWVLDLGAFHGSLDGLEIDACGYVYVTEYLVGTVWRFTPDGSQAEELFSPDSTWIPNLHFGEGLGGWDDHSLYVMDRDQGRVFEVQLDVEGKACPFP
jgi:sugar lactone lactonase YvrE